MMHFIDPIRDFFLAWGALGALVWIVLKILAIAVPVIVTVAFYVVWERKLIGWMHVRHGPMYVGKGILQAFADVFKLLFKEVVQPTVAQPFLFRLAPLITLVPAFAAWARRAVRLEGGVVQRERGPAVPARDDLPRRVRDHPRRLGVELEVRLPRRNARRGAGRVLRNRHGVRAGRRADRRGQPQPVADRDGAGRQRGPVRVVHVAAAAAVRGVFRVGVAETNRAPFDVVEGESEIVAGHMVEYSGSQFALFFLAEYANMILVSFTTAIFFVGGWLSPFHGFGIPLLSVDGWWWLLLKVFFFASAFIWFRASFPRYRYDQIMRLGWKVFIPLTIAWIFVTALLAYYNVFTPGQ
jgi:NADH-quinone oxidoreductase subunit H